MSDSEDRDLLAAEFVLGTLEGEAKADAHRLLRDDPAFAASVRAWEDRLAPLAAAVAPVPPPPELWTRIAEATVAGTGPLPSGGGVVPLVPRRRLRWWQAGTAVSLALAASLAAFAVLRPAVRQEVAVLTPMQGAVPVLLATMQPDGVLRIVPTGAISVATDRALELWALEAGATRPRSLGLLPAAGRRLPARLAAGTQLLVSLEPPGGSPTGQPTGPVLYGGRLAAVN